MVALIATMSLGQIFFKLAANKIVFPEKLTWAWGIETALSPSLIMAVSLYVAGTGFWLLILRQMELSYAYPFVALTFIVVPALGIIFLKEPFSWSLVIGGCFVFCGVAVLAFR